MEINDSDIENIPDRELGDFIRGLTIEIAALQSQVEPDSAPTKRTVRLVRVTILTAGGFFGATVDPWALILTALGMWDWIDSISEDANITNRQIVISQHLADLEIKLAAATVELRKRKLAGAKSE